MFAKAQFTKLMTFAAAAGLLTYCCTIGNAEDKEEPAADAGQGVRGKVEKLIGNFQPTIGGAPGGVRKPLMVPIYVFKGTRADLKKPADDDPQLAAVIKSDKLGEYEVPLPAGTYTVLPLIDGKLYATVFSVDPETKKAAPATVKVEAGKWTNYRIEDTSDAAF